MQQRNHQLGRAVHHALLISALAGSATFPVYAQDKEVEEVVVTGSRIKMANLEGTSPVTQVTSADIATQGVTRVEDLINQAALEICGGKLSAAHGTLVQALDVAEDSSDLDAQAHAHELLGLVAWHGGHPHRAAQAWDQARELYQQAGNDTGQARCLQHQGTALLAAPDGDPREATELLSRSLDLRAEQQSGVGVVLAHLYLAEEAARSGQPAELAEHQRAGLVALGAWTREASEPAEVTIARKRFGELGTGR